MTEPTPDPRHTVAGATADVAGPAAAVSSGTSHYADRYGHGPRPKRWWAAVALTVAVMVAGGGIAYVGWTKFGPKDIEVEQLGYSVLDDSSVDLRIRLTRSDPDVPVVCVVRAMNRDLAEVGRREVVVAPSGDEGTVRFSTVIETSERPASAAIYTCTDKVPGYLRDRA